MLRGARVVCFAREYKPGAPNLRAWISRTMPSPQDCARQFRWGVGVFVVLWALAATGYFVAQFLQRDTLDGAPGADAYDALLYGDMVGAAVSFCAGLLLLLPVCSADPDLDALPRATRTFHTHYCLTLLLLLAGLVSLAVTSRVRDVNMQLRSAGDHVSADENYVCGRRSDPLSCPTQRIQLSEPFRRWETRHPGTAECWLNTSDTNVDAFTFGEVFANATRFATADFARRDTYLAFPEYAECYFYGCGCLPDQRALNENLLRVETFATMFAVITFFLFVCAPTPADYAFARI